MNITQPGGHLDQMIRQTRWHHVQLSSLADVKANIMLSVSSMIITLSIRYLAEPAFKWAALTMMAFCMLTILLAAYAVLPKLAYATRRASAPDVNSPRFNLLFFGDFMHLGYAQFEKAMEDMMNDPSRTYEAQVREIYTLGIFLARKKYRFVRLAYFAFVTGLAVSGAVLVVTGVSW
jgi:hypothetical protein